ncbi:MAG: polyphosphate polymerase domain-containing protein [Verrucomicrobia bacterium]|nr:polyphosphate polymerase domain-containing protein [Verrucomicrobiota bacterium]
MAEDKLQASRFELKYIIPEHVARALRDFVAGYLDIDEFGATQPNFSYPVHSLYLDSPNLSTFHWTINGDKNRYKLRLRFYDNQNESPVFFEIKRRLNNTIAKQRGGVRREFADRLLAGQLPEPSHLLSKDPRQFSALQNFSRLMSHLGARPMAHIFYMREAWISRYDNSVRVTMDREVLCDPEPCARFETKMVNPVRVFGDSVVLELKFTNRFPDWFKDLVRVFGLTQCGAAKYAEGVELLGEHRLTHAFATNWVPAAKPAFLSQPSNALTLVAAQGLAATFV